MKLRASYLSFFTVFLLDRLLDFVNGFSYSAATRMKRIIFVFSVMRVIDSEKGKDPANISDINGRLHLSQSDTICIASAAASEKIWSETDEVRFDDLPVLSMATTPIERELVTSYFLQRCPSWLRYGDASMSDMRRDLHKLFKVIITRNC